MGRSGTFDVQVDMAALIDLGHDVAADGAGFIRSDDVELLGPNEDVDR